VSLEPIFHAGGRPMPLAPAREKIGENREIADYSTAKLNLGASTD
jgi:hypothetical protein